MNMFKVSIICFLFFTINFIQAKDKELTEDLSIKILNANTINDTKDTILLNGNVKISSGNILLKADNVSCNKKKDMIVASGNVYIADNDGNLLCADKVVLNYKLKKGNISTLQAKLVDGSKISAKYTNLDLNKESVANKVLFSSCNSCKDSNRALLWRIKADTVIYDHINEDIIYKNAFLEFFNIPVLFIPRMTHPSPKIERRSGFLTPQLLFSKNLGFIFIPTYLFALSRHSELIIKAALSNKKDRVIWGIFNKKIKNGDFHIALSGTDFTDVFSNIDMKNLTNDELDEVNKIQKHHYRGHVDAKLNIFFNDYDIRLFSNLKKQTDKSYLNRYTFLPNDNASSIDFESSFYESNIGYEWIRNNNYMIAKFSTFQSTLVNDFDHNIPIIAPYIGMDISYPNKVLNGDINLLLHFTNCDFKNYDKDRKLFSQISYSNELLFNNGILLNSNLSIITHLVNINDKENNLYDKQINNISPRASFKISCPLRIKYESIASSAILSPTLLFVSKIATTKNFKNYLDNSNIFSSYYEINRVNLLNNDINDLINCIFRENRVVYGADYTFFKNSEKIFSVFCGQMLFLSNNSLDFETGLGNKHLSDIVFNTSIYFSKNFEVYVDSVFCHQKSKFLRSDIASKMSIGNTDLHFGFSFGDMFNKNKEKKKYKSCFVNFNCDIYNNYALFARYQCGDRNYKSLSSEFGVIYSDECFSWELRLEKTFFKKIDCDNDTKIVMTINFKNLGGFSINKPIGKYQKSREFGPVKQVKF